MKVTAGLIRTLVAGIQRGAATRFSYRMGTGNHKAIDEGDGPG